MKRLLLSGAMAFGAVALIAVATPAVPASANGFLSYNVAAEAPALQITEDFPTAPFHPLAEGDVTHSLATLDPNIATALASIVWPGSAGGNVGSLIGVLGVLGGSSIPALNDPVIAQVNSGAGPPSTSLSLASGTQMTASVRPPKSTEQFSSATTRTGGIGLGAGGGAAASASESTVVLDQDTGTLTATTVSSISDLNLAGLVTVQSATSFAKAVSTGGDPVLSGGAIFQNIKVAGQPAYVDGNGVHLGTPGKPAPSSLLTMVDKVLIQAGLQIYSTAPETVKIGGVSYYYGASLLIYFPVPHDPNGDTLTVAIGGAAIKMEATPGFTTPTSAPTMPPSLTSPGVSGGSGGSGSGLSTSTSPGPVIPPSPAPLRLSLPTTGTPAIPGALGALRPAVSTPHGIPAWWLLLLAGALLLGAFGLTRVPALLAAAAAPACDTPTTRSP